MESIKASVADAIANLTGSKILIILTSSTRPNSLEAAYTGFTDAGYHTTLCTSTETVPLNTSIADLQILVDNASPLFEIQHAQFDALLVVGSLQDSLNAQELVQKFIDADKIIAFYGAQEARSIDSLRAGVTGSATAPATMQDSQDAGAAESEAQRTGFMDDKKVARGFKQGKEQDEKVVRDGNLITGVIEGEDSVQVMTFVVQNVMDALSGKK